MKKTKGQVEAEISEAVIKFEQEYMAATRRKPRHYRESVDRDTSL